jgi:hypothetical protein
LAEGRPTIEELLAKLSAGKPTAKDLMAAVRLLKREGHTLPELEARGDIAGPSTTIH